MANSCLHILSKKEYTATRCQDGILLFWPIEGSMHFQQFMKERILSDELYIVNNMDVFSISDNGITLEVYISSDWFTELGYSFFNYHYISDLIQSKKEIKELVAQLTLNFLDNDVDKEQDIINKIVHILANEAIIDKKIAEDQYMYDYYGELKDELNYIYNHIEERLTLKDISNKLYVSKSNLSTQFHLLLGMGFKKYIDTLKISKSIEMLLTTTKTISQISETLGFSNVSTYSRQFKNYLSVTPNAYRAMKKYDKYNGCSDDDVSEHLKSCVQSLICSKMPTNELDNYDEIVIDQYPISNVSTFYSVVQINSIDEIKMLFLQGIHKKIGYEGSNIIFCIMPNLCQYKNLFSQEEMNDIIKIIIEYRLHVAFSIDKIEQIYELNQLFTYQYENLKIMNKCSVSDYNVQFIFNLNEKSIREIYRNILKIQNIELEYKIGLDISCMFNDTAQFKSLASQIKRLKFDYLYIDNARLKSPYLLDNEEGLLLKNILQFKHLIDDLKQFDFSSENLIFLNLYNHQLLNNNEIDLSNSAPLLFKTISKLKKHFKGYGLNVFSNPKVFNAVHLFDENGFKTTFGLIFNHLSWMTNQNQIEQRFYNIIENADQYYLYLYDWRVIESESNESDFKDVDIWINFEDEALIDEYICVIAKVDDEGGNINHMISQNLRHKYVWSTPFLMRVEENFRPYMHIMEHDFKKGPLKIRMKYNAVYLVEIYKRDKINKRRSTT